jgi:hypothetical protein
VLRLLNLNDQKSDENVSFFTCQSEKNDGIFALPSVLCRRLVPVEIVTPAPAFPQGKPQDNDGGGTQDDYVNLEHVPYIALSGCEWLT